MKMHNFDFSDLNIIVIGDVILDVYFMGEVKRLSPEAPVPVVWVKEKANTLGGAGNVALNVVGLGCTTRLLGIRGDDRRGERLSMLLEKFGILNDLIVDTSHSTTSKTRIIGQGQQLLRIDEEEVWEGSEATRGCLLAKFEDAIERADAVILSDYCKGVVNGEIPREIICQCKKRHIPVFVDSKGGDWERFQGATCITPNTGEVEAIIGSAIGKDDAMVANVAQALQKRYCFDWLVITRGPHGMCLVGSEDTPFFVETRAKEVYDVSGAGDTVIATLAAGVTSGLGFPKATELANIAAGIVVGKLGSQPIGVAELEAASRISKSGSKGVGNRKISTLNAAKFQVKAWRANGEKIVFTNGCFDLLHPGHIHALSQARELGHRLVVGVNADISVRRLKGPSRPIVPEKDRANVLSALSCVDLIVLFEEDTPLSLINSLRPDILVKGGDYSLEQVVGRELVESYGGEVHLVQILEGYSTIEIKENILTK